MYLDKVRKAQYGTLMSTSIFEDRTVVFKRPTVAYVRQPDTMYVIYRGTRSPHSWSESPSGIPYIAEMSPRQIQYGSTPKNKTIREKLLKLSKADEGQYTLFKLGDRIHHKTINPETVYEIFKFNSSGNWIIRSKHSSAEKSILPHEEKDYVRTTKKLGGRTRRDRRRNRTTRRKR